MTKKFCFQGTWMKFSDIAMAPQLNQQYDILRGSGESGWGLSTSEAILETPESWQSGAKTLYKGNAANPRHPCSSCYLGLRSGCYCSHLDLIYCHSMDIRIESEEFYWGFEKLTQQFPSCLVRIWCVLVLSLGKKEHNLDKYFKKWSYSQSTSLSHSPAHRT